MARLFNKSKTIKEKLQLLKDLASGKKSLESMMEATRPGRHFNITENQDGSYTCDGKTMTKEEYEEWYKSQDIKENDWVWIIRVQKGNDPLADTNWTYPLKHNEPNNGERIWEESKTYENTGDKPDTHITEFKDYSGKEKGNNIIDVTVLKRTPDPVNEPIKEPEAATIQPKPKRIKKAATVTIEKAPVEQIGETFTFKRPPFRRDLDMAQYRGFTDSVKRLFNNF